MPMQHRSAKQKDGKICEIGIKSANISTKKLDISTYLCNMKQNVFLTLLALAVAIGILSSSCTPEPLVETPETTEQEQEQEPKNEENEENGNEDDTTPQEQSMTITITVGSQVFKADIEDTETGKAFIAKLPLTLDMCELNQNEKYCYGVSLPRDDKYYDSIAAGDLMLYSGNCIVLFYDRAGGYSYTRIGTLTGTEGLKEALGTGSVRVSFAKE